MPNYSVYLREKLNREISQEALQEDLSVSQYLKALVEVMFYGTTTENRREAVRGRIRELEMAKQ